ncbi:MAG: Holliday junction resolvase RuvX [Candidatus Buchananbacteria bacterium]|nr:Holliday junction resolvase RuvX [Candidatus Buchananbacteria bacterium]
MKFLGIDYGARKVGLAVGDSESRLAQPLKIIINRNWQQLTTELKVLCDQERIELVIIGLPENPEAKRSAQLEAVADFAAELQKHLVIPVITHNERYSTQQAQHLVSGGADDAVAAMITLQDYLDINHKT